MPNIPLLVITAVDVEKLLKNLKVNKSSGPDQIPNILIKECAEELAPALHAIFLQSLETGALPDVWRNANISLMFMKGNKHFA